MRDLSGGIIVHCSDTRTNQSFNVDDIDRWHRERGWTGIGYHFYIRLDGTVEKGRSLDKAGAHTFGHNKNTIGICFEGGKNENNEKWDKPTDEQIDSFSWLVNSLEIVLGRKMTIKGHYEYANKTCPNFDIDILR